VKDDVKTEWVRRLGLVAKVEEIKPEVLPEHYQLLYDCMAKRWRAFLSNSDPKRDEWPLIAVMADELHQRDQRIAALEERLQRVECGASYRPLDRVSTESVDNQLRIDMRTREGRALKQAQTVGV